MPELVAPGNCPEMVAAAVQNGADAVYMGFGVLGASKTKPGMSVTDFARSAEFCRVRGVNVYGLMNIFAVDSEYDKLYEAAMYYNRMGANAIIAQDLGVIRFLHQALPEMPIIGGENLAVHDMQGIKLCSAMGLKRVILPTELTEKEIARLGWDNSVELEVTVHGPLCMAYPGECHMNALFGDKRSRICDRCGELCRTELTSEGRSGKYPLRLRDVCLIERLEDLTTAGVTAFRIAGYSREPEYVAMVTGMYSRAIREGEDPTREEFAVLQSAYSPAGFTQGVFSAEDGVLPEMQGGIDGVGTKANPKFFAALRRYYINNEYQRVPLKFAANVKPGRPVRIAALDDKRNISAAEGDIPTTAYHSAMTPTTLQTQLFKLGGTPFYCDGVRSVVEPGLTVAKDCVPKMVRNITDDIIKKRKVHLPFEERPYPHMIQTPNPETPPVVTVSVRTASQLGDMTSISMPAVVYIPVDEIMNNRRVIEPFMRDPNVEVVAALPKLQRDGERQELERKLTRLHLMGVDRVLAESLSQIIWAKEQGFRVRGGFGLNAYNSRTLGVLRYFNLDSAAVPFELRLSQIDAMAKELPIEIMGYGRMPVMMTAPGMLKGNPGISDRSGFNYPVFYDSDHGNTVMSAKKLFLADKAGDYSHIGLWGVRLCFTTENSMECAAIVRRYLGDGDYSPQAITRGSYYPDGYPNGEI